MLLIRATVDEPDKRRGMIDRLLRIPGTGSSIRVIADLVDHWDELSSYERQALRSKILTDVPDAIWRKAAALTRKYVPSELERDILGEKLTLSQEPIYLLHEMNRELLEACLSIYMGNPQPLWYIGTHHQARDTWRPLVEQAALDPTSPLFEAAWEEVTLEGDGKYVAALVRQINVDAAVRVFDVLLQIKSATNGNFMPEVWAELLLLAPTPEQLLSWIKQMCDIAPLVIDSYEDFDSWLDGENRKAFLEYFKHNFFLTKFLGTISKEFVDSDEELIDGISKTIVAVITKGDHLIAPTYSIAIRAMKELGLAESHYFKEVQRARDEFYQRRDRPSMPSIHMIPVRWTGPR